MPASLSAGIGDAFNQVVIGTAAPTTAGTVQVRMSGIAGLPAAVSLAVAPGRAINQVTLGSDAPTSGGTVQVRIADGLGPDDALDALDTIVTRMQADHIGRLEAMAIARTLRARMVADRIQGTP